jgi:hypothetical protein
MFKKKRSINFERFFLFLEHRFKVSTSNFFAKKKFCFFDHLACPRKFVVIILPSARVAKEAARDGE